MKDSSIKYCVTAYIDLAGFGNHLELGNDLRTNIGQEALKRLRTLESAIEKFELERKRHRKHYPKTLHYQRINDSIVLTMDLPDYLVPDIGQIVKKGLAVKELKEFFSEKELESEESFTRAYEMKNIESILELSQFIGLVSRLHFYVNKTESQQYFPGAKTIVAAGFRKSFVTRQQKEDFFSANFSFANAYTAEHSLKGQHLYIDNNILWLLGRNTFANNLIKKAVTVYGSNIYDPFSNPAPSERKNKKTDIPDPIVVELFRKSYIFRSVNSQTSALFHLFPAFLNYLNGSKKLKGNKKNVFRGILENFNNDDDKINFNFQNDIDENIEMIRQFVIYGKSSITSKN
ncbi:MAG: hypothetical protein GY816_14500 [Cytophagales bacterium]|nr:hypothetical protein [Cytophagales bacterium]